MDNNETILEEEIGTETEIDTADVEEDATGDADRDDEFEYDEDGNIIIPDVVFDEEEEEDSVSVEDEGETEDKDDSEESTDASAESEETEEVAEPQGPSEADTLRAELDRLRAQCKDTLAKMGVKEDDVMKGLASLAAEADGISVEEYTKNQSEEERRVRAERLLAAQEFEKLARADLAELHAAYPETKQYDDVRKLPEDILKKFGRFRDAGLSAKEAYAAANPDGIRNVVATAVKKQSLHESKGHLQSAVPKGSKDNSVVMTKSELATWRDLFPGKSDKEIVELYKKTANKGD